MLCALVIVGQTSTLDAGVFDNLASAANGALPGYGRDAVISHRQDLSVEVIREGLREALRVGCDNVVSKLESDDSYTLNSSTRIALPADMARLQRFASRLGYSRAFDELEQKINEVALETVPLTRDELKKAIDRLEIRQARAVLTGGYSQATELLRDSLGERVGDRLLPVVQDSATMLDVNRVSRKLLKRLAPFTGRKTADQWLELELARHVVSESLDGFFRHLAKEELAIRSNPSSRTTELLRKVFG